MADKKWQEYGRVLKDVFALSYSLAAVSRIAQPFKQSPAKTRMCKAILDAGNGSTVQLGKANNACFGASWHLGFTPVYDDEAKKLLKKFVVEGEKLFCSYEALDTFLAQLPEPDDNEKAYFELAPLEQSTLEPQLVIFICNPEAASRIVSFLTFFDGKFPDVKITGPTCRMSIAYPLKTHQANISFIDPMARKLCKAPKDMLLVTLPYAMIPRIIDALARCSAGNAPIEFPKECKDILKKHLSHG